MALHSVITPGRLGETIWDAGDRILVGHVQGKVLRAVLSLQFFKKNFNEEEQAVLDSIPGVILST